MKTPNLLRITLFLIAGILTGLMLHGQEIPDILKKRHEIYFSFQVKSPLEISSLTNMISIDNVNDKTVWAYANIPQYLKFLKLGYEITVLPAPGDAPGVVMRDNVNLSPLTTWNYYPTYTAYESLMAQFQSMYPNLCHLDTITTLASGRRLLVLKISDNASTDEPEPEFFYSSSMHGDETTGYVLMLHLADYLLSNYGTNPEATDLVNNMEIYICPLANPDGTYYGGNSSVSGARRGNINNVDLNRNYPDYIGGQHPDGYAWQPETVAFMDFASQHHFVGACNFHGGVEVVNYPWDATATLHPDDNWYQYISREYADTVHLHAPSGYMTYLNNGITNGYAWYLVYGGRQDWMNNYQHCREITVEISNVKLLAANLLEPHWTYNWRSFILLLKESKYGIQGIITDQITGSPVAAKVFITGHDASNSEVYSSASPGDYHRPVKAGTYTLEISAPCYQTQTITGVTIADHASLTLNIQLVPGATAAVTTTAVTSITSTSALSGGNVSCTGNTAVTAKGVCWSTSANPVVTGNHTTNGSGAGSFTSTITGLSALTVYHVRAYATNASGTYYGADVQFTTSCGGAIISFPWNEGFENAGVIPGCWTQEYVTTPGLAWTFIKGNGSTNPSTAHTGNYNACLKDATSADNKTKLVTPQLNLTSIPNPQLKFYHQQQYWSGDQDILTVFYKTSTGGAWTQLATYTASITTWTLETIILPNPSADYYIAFEGNAKYGYGVCVDDVQVSTSCVSTYPVSVTITADANPVYTGTLVTFSATAVNGGLAPVYLWKVNNVSSGTNSPVFAYIPVNNDVITCTLTSNATCVTGNPAASNPVSMTVNYLPQAMGLQNLSIADVQCFNASQTITVAGNGTSFTVVSGGSATLIAGQNILYLPGTVIDSGAYMYGFIVTNGLYCNQPAFALISPNTGNIELPSLKEQSYFKIFPNPTSGVFTLETSGFGGSEKVLAEIYGMRGEKLESVEWSGEKAHQFSLSGRKAGIYLVRVISGKYSGTSRVIKHD